MSRRFDFNWKLTLFAALCLVMFINLGFWQLDREVEKKRLQESLNELAGSPGESLSQVGKDVMTGKRVRLIGRFNPEVILLLDNRVLDGKVGFEVHQLFHDEFTDVLINRGFVQMGRTRADLPDIDRLQDFEGELEATVYKPSSDMVLLHNEVVEYNSYPVIVQHVDIVQFGDLVNREVFPHVLRLNEGEPGALPRYWPASVMSPEQHRGYAIQWFTMAFAVVAAWLAFSFRQRGHRDTAA